MSVGNVMSVAYLILEPSIVGIMPIIYLSLVVDDGKQIILIHSLGTRKPYTPINVQPSRIEIACMAKLTGMLGRYLARSPSLLLSPFS